MLIQHSDKRPIIDPTARIAPTAVICGDVTVGPSTSVGFGAVLTAESGPIAVGRECVIMENAVIRGTRRHPVTVDLPFEEAHQQPGFGIMPRAQGRHDHPHGVQGTAAPDASIGRDLLAVADRRAHGGAQGRLKPL